MLKNFFLFSLVFFLCAFSLYPTFASASEELPRPDENGDFSLRSCHDYWEVIDPDPEGLNGRLTTAFSKEWYAPCDVCKDMNISEWPVIRTFSKGTILIANGIPAGFIGMTDEDNNPWLKITIGPDDEICFIRANSKYIKPVNPSAEVLPIIYRAGIVNDPDGYTNMRAGKGTDSEVIEKILEGEYFLIISPEGDWWKVLSLSGNTGYIHSSRIEVVKENVIGAAASVIEDTPIRKGPFEDYPVIKNLSSGSNLILLSYSSEEFDDRDPRDVITSWAKIITSDGTEGYVDTNGLKWIALPDK